jgi:lipopolysaccharide export system permease protein
MILFRYIIREHVLPFLYATAVIVFILAMNWAVQLLDMLINKGLEPGVVLELFLIQLGWIIALTIPMAILVATLMTFGAMSADNEITAVKASGRNLSTLLVPVVVSSAVLAVMLVFFNNMILPDANHRASNLGSDISRKKPAAFIDPGVLIKDFQNYVLYVDKVNHRSGLMHGIKVFSDMPGQDPSTTVADSGYVTMTANEQYLKLTLYNGESHTVKHDSTQQYFRSVFEKQVLLIQNVDTRLQRTDSQYRGDREKSTEVMLAEVGQFKKNRNNYQREYLALLDSSKARIRSVAGPLDSLEKVPDSLSVKDTSKTFADWVSSLRETSVQALAVLRTQQQQAARLSRQIQNEQTRIAQYMVEIHKKYAIPVTCIVFVLIGAPLGIMARRGGIAVGASYSIFFFIVFWACYIGGEFMADRMYVRPWLAMWSGNIIIGIAGLILLSRMIRETTFISFDWILKLRQSITGLLHRRKQTSGVMRTVDTVIRFIVNIPYYLIRWFIGILPSYLLRKFIGTLIGVLIGVIVVFVVVDYVSNLKRFEMVSWQQIALYYWYYLPWFLTMVIPIAILLATMFAVGGMAKNSELVAMRGAGINILQLSLPLMITGLLLAGFGFYFAENQLPAANLKRKELGDQFAEGRFKAATGTNREYREFRRSFYYFGGPNTVYYFEEFRTHPQKTFNVRRETFKGSSVVERIEAKALDCRDSSWRFISGIRRVFSHDTAVMSAFDTLADSVLHATPDEMVVRIKSKEEMSYWELSDYIEKVKKQGEKVNMHLADLHFKVALPFMNFIVILLGVAITARMGRKGGAVLFGVGLLVAFSYWILSRFGLAFAQNGQLTPVVGAWLGNCLFLLLGLLLIRRAVQ